MDIQDRSGGSQSNGVFRTVNRISLDGASHSLNTVHPNVRKPYTITKQRQKWTEQEHNKFIQALKLYGRYWRRIEEHVGTKTAVQIRSHSQKFFYKVVRQSGNADANSVMPIEKPTHPYPRKLFAPFRKGTSVSEQKTMSGSPNSYVSDQENQSPTSILFAIGSEILGTTDSNIPEGSVDEGSTWSFKLFGTNMLVNVTDKLSKEFCESPVSSGTSDVKRGQSLPCEFSGMSMEGKWNPRRGVPAAVS